MPMSIKEKLLVGAGVAGLCWGVYKLYRYIRRRGVDDDGDDEDATVLSSTPPPPPPPSSDLPVPPAFTPPPEWVFRQPYRNSLPREILLGQLEEREIQAMEELSLRRAVERRQRLDELFRQREREDALEEVRARRARGDGAGPSGGGGH